MKPKTLRPVRDREVYSKLMTQKLEFELYSLVFKPILDIFGLSLRQVRAELNNSKELRNAQAGLAEAILEGRIVLSDGFLKGHFTAAISKEIYAFGGKFYPKQKAWKIDGAKLPPKVLLAISSIREKTHEKVEEALGFLDSIQKDGLKPVDLNEVTDGILGDLEKQFVRTVPKDMEVAMSMSGYIEKELKGKYTENLNLYIKGWADESIIRLRGEIQKNAVQGYRAESMRQSIISEYGVSARKAKFLARQETSLLVSGYREANYKEAGINFYQWSSSRDRRVRPLHRELDGQIFSWQNPPIIDARTGERGNPGEAFGCRCVAVPVLMSQMDRLNEMAKSGRVFKGDLTNV